MSSTDNTEIGNPASEQPKAPVMEKVKITVTGIRASGNIQQVLEMEQPQGTPAAHAISSAWCRIGALNAMVFDVAGESSQAEFFPLGSFEKVLVTVSPAVGVSLA